MNADPNRCRTSRHGWLMLALLACLQSGCAMCGNEFDDFYASYGGCVQREDMVCGRVNSAFRPAGPPGNCPCKRDQQSQQPDREYESREAPADQERVPATSDGAEADFSEVPYDFDGEDFDMLAPGAIEEMSYAAGWEDEGPPLRAVHDADGYGPEGYDSDGYGGLPRDASHDVYSDQRVFEPDYGYDTWEDAAPADHGRNLHGTQSRSAEVTGPVPPADRLAAPSMDPIQPIGSGVAPRRPMPASRSTMIPSELPMTPEDEFVEKLLPMSSPPPPGYLRRPDY